MDNELDKLYHEVLKKIVETNNVTSAQLIIINMHDKKTKPNNIDTIINGGMKIVNAIDKIVGGGTNE